MAERIDYQSAVSRQQVGTISTKTNQDIHKFHERFCFLKVGWLVFLTFCF